VRLATYNLLHGVDGRDGTAEPRALAAAIARLDADVLGLQEVDRAQPRSGGADQTAVAAEALGAEHWRFAPTLHGTPGPRRQGATWWPATGGPVGAPSDDTPAYGVGLVSRLPARGWWLRRYVSAPLVLPLLVPARPRPRLMLVADEPRAVLATVLERPDGRGLLTVATAHLSFVPGWNVAQLRRVTRWLARMPQPIVLLGDFNLPGRIPELATGWSSLARVATYPSYGPRVQFDHVLARGISPGQVIATEVVPLPISDHAALVVEVDL